MHQELLKNISNQERILILGYGLTGQAVADFCDHHKIHYYILDDLQKIERSGDFFKGQISSKENLSLSANKIKALIPSPGVPLSHPIITVARKANIPILGELECASYYLDGEFIAVTGTNGKSTSVRLINSLLTDAGVSNALKGNIGSPLISAVNEPPQPYYVIEESSYQLELVGTVRHKIAICLNVTHDHFDRYKNLDGYVAAKMGIFKNSKKTDYFIFNQDDPRCLRMSYQSPATNIPFSLVNHLNEGAFIDGDEMVIRIKSNEFRFDINECSLKGLHNLENMLASLLAVLLIRDDESAISSYKQTLKNFIGLPHRLQKIHIKNDVVYYDDSKATNVGAVVMALASFDKNVVLIAGGKDKHCDYLPLKSLIQAKVKNLILLGEAKEAMFEVFKDATKTDLVKDMREAVMKAFHQSKPGDVVLLSPACSSFDQYKNFEERGKDFQKLVKEICR